MRISYLFNSSLPSTNPGSLQVIKTCEAIKNQSNKVFLITPNTGLNKNIKKFYGLKKIPIIKKLKYFKSFPQGINYYLFSLFSIAYAISMKTEIYLTRNLFTLFILILLRKKTIIEIHHDLSNEGRIIKFLYNYLRLFNSKNIIKIIAITNSVKKYLIKKHKVDKKKITIIPSASDLKLRFKKFNLKKKYKIGYFGSLEKSKGSEFIIRLSKLDKENQYYIYGGESKAVLNLKKKFFFKNLNIFEYVPYNRLSHFIDKMDIVLMPSNRNKLKSIGGVGNISKYTSPVKLFDYLASGKLIISSRLKVFEEIIKDKENCIMIKKLNPKSWLKIIRNLKNRLNEINRIKKNALLLSKNFTYEKRAEKILKNLKLK